MRAERRTASGGIVPSFDELEDRPARLRFAQAPEVVELSAERTVIACPTVDLSLPGPVLRGKGKAADSYWDVGGKANRSTTEIHNVVNGYKVYAAEAEAMGMTAGGHRSIGNWPHVHYPKEDSPGDKYTLLEINAEMEKRFGKPHAV